MKTSCNVIRKYENCSTNSCACGSSTRTGWTCRSFNSTMTIYGTRSHQTESKDDVSLEGFSKALNKALELHSQFPKNKTALLAKRGPDSEVKVPEQFATFKGKYGAKLNYEGKVVQSCIHCHQVGEALRLTLRAAGQPLSERILSQSQSQDSGLNS